MNVNLLIENLTNPALLFFVLGIIAVYLKSDLEIPENSSKFISLYLLFAIGFKGGQELSHETFSTEIIWSLLFGIGISATIPIYTFFILKRKLNLFDSVAIAAAYGSVSAVTFVTAASYLESHQLELHGNMVAIMALMESPAIIMAVLLANMLRHESNNAATSKVPSLKNILHESFTDGAQLLLLGSMVVGLVSGEAGQKLMAPFSIDLFKGMLAFFLLDMGLMAARNIQGLQGKPPITLLYAIASPLSHALIALALCKLIGLPLGNTILLMVLASSASYIAVPAVLRDRKSVV